MLSEKPVGFILTNQKIENNSVFKKIGDFFLYCSKKNEDDTEIFVKEFSDHCLIFSGEFIEYDHNNLEYFVQKFYKNFKENELCALNKLYAEISLVIVDKIQNNVICIRDKMGFKDIFYAKQDSFLYIFNRFDHVRYFEKLFFDDFGLSLYVSSNNLTLPYTIFNNIFGLPAAHYIKLDFHFQFDISKSHIFYWELPSIDIDTDPKVLFKELKDTYVSAIGKRLQREKNTILYSGGLDSSTVLYGMLENTEAKNVLPYFMQFGGYEVQKTFGSPVQRVCKELGLNLKIVNVEELSHDRFQDTIEIIKHVPIFYPTLDIFHQVSNIIIAENGIGTTTFLGESSDGVFGLNVTGEGVKDRLSGIKWNEVILRTNYSETKTHRENITKNLISRIIHPLRYVLPKPIIVGHIEAFSGLLKHKNNPSQIAKGLYFAPNRLPTINEKYLYRDALNRDANKKALDFFENEYLRKIEKYFSRDGIGGVSKILSYRSEIEGNDMKMKMVGNYYGMKTVFPISDAKFMEQAYCIPNKYYMSNAFQRPKFPLRKIAELLNIPKYILDKEKITSLGNRKAMYFVSLEKDRELIEKMQKFTNNSSLISILNKTKSLNLEIIRQYQIGFYSKNHITRLNAWQLFRLQSIIKDYNINGIK